jgi:hypothetical protein
MAVTVTYAARLQNNLNVNSHAARDTKFAFGSIAFETTYTGGGATLTFSGFRNVSGIMIPPASGFMFEYRPASEVVVIRGNIGSATSTAQVLGEIPSDTQVGSWSALPFLAWGN